MSFMAWVSVWQGRFLPMPQHASPSYPRTQSTSIVPPATSPEQQAALSASQKDPPAHCAVVSQVVRQPASSHA
jgi:hypothetical protein